MALKIQEMPEGAGRALLDAKPWRELEAAAAPQFTLLSSVPDVADLPSHPFYYMSLLELVTSGNFDRAIIAGWHAITVSDGMTWSTLAERVSDRAFRYGRRQPLNEAESRLSQLNSLRALVPDLDSCELRAVTAPPLLNLALWLQNPAEKKNYIIPIHTCSRHLKAGLPYGDGEIVSARMGPARSLLEFTPNLSAPHQR